MPHVYKALIRELSAGRPAVLAAIIGQAGSAPRSLGTKFLYRQDGSLEGSIGGGRLEARVMDAARDLMGRDAARVLDIRMTGDEVAGTDMICGGEVDVLVQAFGPEAGPNRDVLEAVLRLLEKGGRGILAAGPLPAPGSEGRVSLILYQPEAGTVGTIDDDQAVARLIASEAERILGTNTTQVIPGRPGGPSIVLEPLYSRPTALIFGGGHISVHLAPLLAMADFRVIVADDRAEFAGRERFPQAERLVVAEYGQCLDQLDFTPETYCIIVTRGHLHDKTVLEGVLARPFRYAGMIGSRRKRNIIYDALIKEGADPERIKMVHSPIGLDIGAETPEEIAISIAAEMIKVRAEGLRLVKDWKV